VELVRMSAEWDDFNKETLDTIIEKLIKQSMS